MQRYLSDEHHEDITMKELRRAYRMSNKKTVLGALLTAVIGAIYMPVALAEVSAEEAAQLGGDTLTRFGAEKAGNADGSIPAYTNGLQSSTLSLDEDPFPDEKPLYTITAANMAQYEDLLVDGTKLLLQRHDEYRVDVYPSHRTMSYPDWVLENTVKNATTATLGGKVEGDDLLGAGDDGLPYPGIPFPIPKTGYEVMWNNTAKYAPPIGRQTWSGYLVDAGGAITELPHLDGMYVHPRYDRTGSLQKVVPKGTQFGFNATLTDPPSSAGIVFLNFYTSTGSKNGGQKVYFYTPGQRRVRLAPEFAYDVPIAGYGGVTIWDEIWNFVGRLDRFDFKLIGKEEKIIPYNSFLTEAHAPPREMLGDNTINPDYNRWEKHRVWVVEATRKSDARHAYAKRRFYVDEDTWCVIVQESWDDAGNLYRHTYSPTHALPGADGGLSHYSWVTYDMIKGNYFILGTYWGGKGDKITYYNSLEEHPRALSLTPNGVQASGVR